MDAWIVTGLWVAVLSVAWLIRRSMDRYWADNFVVEFMRRYPGRCFPCWYWRMGVLHACTWETKPPPHVCIEKDKA